MTWRTRIEGSKMEITTGDGNVYFPLWKEPKKNVNYNTEGFDFVGLEGTYVQRENKSGTQYPLTLFFTGENNIEDATAFEISARDKRPWKIKHPLYDDLSVQPLSLEIDDTELNVTKITCVVWESIENKYPSSHTSVKDSVLEKRDQLNETTTAVYAENIKSVDTKNVSGVTLAINKINAKYESITDNVSELKGYYRESLGAVDNITQDISSYITKLNALINFPFLLQQTTQFKIEKLIDQFSDLKDIFITALTPTEQQKQFFDINSVGVIVAAFSCASNPLLNTDFSTREDVIRVIGKLNDLYNDYLATIDNLGYDRDPDLSIQMDNIINTVISNLYDIAFNSKQERSKILDVDINTILLAHKYFGRGDDNLDSFIALNKIELSEMLQLKKGRLIKWLV